MELLSPAGSAEGVSAAVQSGADAVYLSFATLSERKKWDLTEDELGRAAQFAHVRGAKIYVVLDYSHFDLDMAAAVENARRASRMGADALIADDLGLIWALRRAIPSMPIHAGEALGIHDLDGVKLCAAMGVTRVALPRELPKAELEAIVKDSPIETEICVHGPLCAAFQGQCMIPALRGADPGPCPGYCHTGFKAGIRERHPVAMKDLCLIGEAEFLLGLGVTALRIDGRERRPEYCAAVTGVWSRAIGTLRTPSEEDMELLRGAFPAAGFTDAYLTGAQAESMMGVAEPEPEGDTPFYTAVRKNYLNHEFQRVPVTFDISLELEQPFRLSATDDRGNTVSGEGGVPELAFHTETTQAMLQTELFKTGGTPFRFAGLSARIQKGIYLDPKLLAPVRDGLLQELLEMRVGLQPRAEGVVPALPSSPGPSGPPVLTVSVQRCSQLSPKLLSLAPPVLYVPLEEAVSGDKRLEPFLDSKDITVCAALPEYIYGSESGRVAQLLLKARQLGITEVAASNIGHIIFARKLGFTVRGDLALNVRNSNTLAVLLGLRLKSAALAMDMSASQVRSLEKYMDTELVIYGRMPLMHTGLCLIRAQSGVCSCDSALGFPDSSGFINPVTRSFGCRNTLWSAQKLHLIKRSREYLTAGLWGVRLSFTTENADECAKITERYLELGTYEPSSTTQGKF